MAPAQHVKLEHDNCPMERRAARTNATSGNCYNPMACVSTAHPTKKQQLMVRVANQLNVPEGKNCKETALAGIAYLILKRCQVAGLAELRFVAADKLPLTMGNARIVALTPGL